jgi:hypothetical protein
LIDSGAQTSFISEKYFVSRRFNKDEVQTKKRWVSATGSPLEINRQTTLTLKIGNKIIKAPFIISKNLSFDVIMGVDIMEANKFTIDFEKKELRCGKNSIQLKTMSKTKSLVCAKIQMELEPHSFRIYRQRLDPNMLDKQIIIERAGKVEIIEWWRKLKMVLLTLSILV